MLTDTQGFVAHRDQTATKTDTPLNEIPQSITVIDRAQLGLASRRNPLCSLRSIS